MKLFSGRRDRSTAESDAVAGPVAPTRRVIHIGPHKTGTTTVQSAFHHNRDAIAERGIHYVGPRLQPTQAVKAMTGVGSSGQTREDGKREWAELADKARHSGARDIVISSEFLCEADDDVARQIVADLGGPADTRVVITLRPLASIFPSQWQQFVQSSTTMALDEWTEAVLDHAEQPTTVGLFWRRHQHDELVRRWAAIVGPENVTVIVLDSRDKGQIIREFARLLDLPEDLLTPVSEVTNRSLTWEEAEAIRAFNIEFAEINARRAENGRPKLPLNVDERLAAWRHVKRRTPEPDEHRITLPATAAERVAALSNSIVDNIVASGAQLVGDIDLLRQVPADANEAAGPTMVSTELASRLANGLMLQTRRRKD
ncbi:hypothetical protein [Nocardioides terrisoli]|uniref:hypothetical protein n=1 Tax=Nocardioides terrisoli TaxID=3388267 RepID=UPI00287B5EBF|nr:hypothetical protein [Nocardioides marmorisolisilvae]